MEKNKSGSFDIISILKYCMVLVFIVYIAILTMMQGGTKTPVKTMQKNVLAVMGSDGMKKGTTQDLKKYYSLNAEDYKGVTLYIPDDVMGVNELLLVRLSDTAQAESVEKAARERLSTQKESFEGYGASQTRLINSAVVESRGDYVLLVISKKADAVQSAFRKSL